MSKGKGKAKAESGGGGRAPRWNACYLVVGPESTGTRFLTSILMDCGCKGGDDHFQLFDKLRPQPSMHRWAVWRRSVPHGNRWPPLAKMVEGLLERGYDEVTALITTREPCALARSQVDRKHAKDEGQGGRLPQDAYMHIFAELHKVRKRKRFRYFVVPYEALALQGGKAVRTILEWLGLPEWKPGAKRFDGNKRHYE